MKTVLKNSASPAIEPLLNMMEYGPMKFAELLRRAFLLIQTIDSAVTTTLIRSQFQVVLFRIGRHAF